MFTEMLTNAYLTIGGNFISLLPFYSIISQLLVDEDLKKGLGFLGAGLTGVGMIGASVGQGLVGYGACIAIGRNPETAPKITSTLIITAGFCESGAIYALVIAILLIFVAS